MENRDITNYVDNRKWKKKKNKKKKKKKKKKKNEIRRK